MKSSKCGDEKGYTTFFPVYPMLCHLGIDHMNSTNRGISSIKLFMVAIIIPSSAYASTSQNNSVGVVPLYIFGASITAIGIWTFKNRKEKQIRMRGDVKFVPKKWELFGAGIALLLGVAVLVMAVYLTFRG
jgi:hypothetical protein